MPLFVSIQPVIDKVKSIHLRLPSGIEIFLTELSRLKSTEWMLEIEQSYAELKT